MFEDKKQFSEFLHSVSKDENVYIRLLGIVSNFSFEEITDNEKLINQIEKSISINNDMIKLANEKILNLEKKSDDDTIPNDKFFVIANEKAGYEKNKKMFLMDIKLLQHLLEKLNYNLLKHKEKNKFYVDNRPVVDVFKHRQKLKESLSELFGRLREDWELKVNMTQQYVINNIEICYENYVSNFKGKQGETKLKRIEYIKIVYDKGMKEYSKIFEKINWSTISKK